MEKILIAAVLSRGLVFAFIWWLLAEGRTDSWGVGGISVALALAASLALSPPGRMRLSPRGLSAFIGFFLIQSVRGGVQVAALALCPRMDLAPALLDLPVSLPEGIGRVLLVSTLNLLPGTLSVRVEGDRLRLHVLDARLPTAEEVRDVEARIVRLLGDAP